MKSQKGLTLISVSIYVIVMIVVVGVISVVTGAFMKTLKSADFNNDPIAEYTTFNSYFSEEVNHQGLKVVECQNDYIVFDNGVQYSFIAENSGIYRNQVKICRDIENCTFSQSENNGKTIITVKFKAGGQERNTIYTLK